MKPTLCLDTHELAWAAGFFDAQGTISVIGKNGKYQNIRFAILQPELSTLVRFQKAIGGRASINGPYTSKDGTKRRPRYTLSSNSTARALVIASMLWPWLSEPKRLKFRQALQTVGVGHVAAELKQARG